MPKFLRSFLVVFNAESENESCFFGAGDFPAEIQLARKHRNTIKPQKPERRTLPDNKTQICVINFPFGSTVDYKSDYNFQDLGIIKEESIQKGEFILKQLFENVKAYSAIYLDIHGRKGESDLIQIILVNKINEIEKNIAVRIDMKYIATLMKKYISEQHHIKIHLLSCYAAMAANLLMTYLAAYGFVDTCVVFYKEAIRGHFSKEKARLSYGRLAHLISKDGYFLSDGVRSRLENKGCFHNYDCPKGSIKGCDYFIFKRDFLIPALKAMENLATKKACEEGADKRIEQFITLYEILSYCAKSYIDNYQKTLTSRTPSQSQLEAAKIFLEKINQAIENILIRQHDVEAFITLEDLTSAELNMMLEFPKMHHVNRMEGNLFIIDAARAAHTFFVDYQDNPERLGSPIFKAFFTAMTGCAKAAQATAQYIFHYEDSPAGHAALIEIIHGRPLEIHLKQCMEEIFFY